MTKRPANSHNGHAAPPDSSDQAALDLEDAKARLDAVRRAILRKSEAEARVRELQAALRQAKRRLREAGWELVAIVSAERRAERKE